MTSRDQRDSAPRGAGGRLVGSVLFVIVLILAVAGPHELRVALDGLGVDVVLMFAFVLLVRLIRPHQLPKFLGVVVFGILLYLAPIGWVSYTTYSGTRSWVWTVTAGIGTYAIATGINYAWSGLNARATARRDEAAARTGADAPPSPDPT